MLCMRTTHAFVCGVASACKRKGAVAITIMIVAVFLHSQGGAHFVSTVESAHRYKNMHACSCVHAQNTQHAEI